MPEVAPQPNTPQVVTKQPGFNWKGVLIAVLIGAVVIGAATAVLRYYLSQSQSSLETGSVTIKTATPSAKTATPSAKPGEIAWTKYANTRLGFSMDLPTINETYKSNGKTVTAPIKVTAFEDGDFVYIDYDKGIVCKDEKNYSPNCDAKVVPNSLEKIKKEPYAPNYWRLAFGNVSNDSELESFLKKSFWPACTLGNKSPSDQAGVYSVQVNGDGKDWGESKCIINFSYVFKYYPAKNKAVAWSLGMDCKFPNSKCLNEDIVKSFKFL